MNIVTLSVQDQNYLFKVIQGAVAYGRNFRLSYGEHDNVPFVMVKVGGGMWSAPLYSVK